MYKVLVIGMSQNYGGIENVIFNYYNNFDRTKIQFDFCKSCKQKIAYEDTLKKWGSNIFYIPSKSTNLYKYKKYVNRFFKKFSNKYDCIWVNRNDLVNIDYLKLAKKYGIPRRIIHSHNVQFLEKSRVKSIVHKLNSKLVSKYATDFWACSSDASKWFYSSKIRSEVVIVKNAINVSKFRYNGILRTKLKRKLGLEDKYVVGNVGRLGYQKNQIFLIKVFAKFLKLNPSAILVLIGQGDQERSLKALVKNLGLEKKVLFLGMKTNVQDLYNLFDIFVFPSRFEGLGIAGIEAQANGLTCFASENRIPNEIKINPNFHFISLDKSELFWAKMMNKHINEMRINSKVIKNNFELAGYSLNTASKYLQNLFLGKNNK